MTRRMKIVSRTSIILLGVSAGAYYLATARAAGIPATDTLVYSGTLEDSGSPASGSVSMRVSLFDDPMVGTQRCTTGPVTVQVSSGHFSVVLPAACVTAVQQTPDLWVEITVQSTVLPRTRIGAVPYAVEAARASAAAGTLDTRIGALEGVRDLPAGTTLNGQPIATGTVTSTYVHWGRPDCPASASLIYAGYVAGSHYTQTGSGANYLCLHETPEWPPSFNDGNQTGALLYGVEYEPGTAASGLVGAANANARCAVCAVSRSAQLMIPGRTSCPSGWTPEYSGYLMGDHYTHPKSEYICVNGSPDTSSGSTNDDQALIYLTEAQCGSLPCTTGRYVQSREVACVVCSK